MNEEGYLKDGIHLVTLSLLSWLVFYYKLGEYPLRGMDEGIYGNLARHMIQDGNWLVGHMYYLVGLEPAKYRPFLEKPPLVPWMQAFSMFIFDVNEFAVRAPSATFGMLTVFIVYYIGKVIFNERAGLFSGVIYLTIPFHHLGMNSPRHGGTDPVLVFFGTIFVVLMYHSLVNDSPKLFVPAGLAAGLAVLTKGFAAGIFILVILPIILKEWKSLISWFTPLSAAIFSLIAFSWPILMIYEYGEFFIQKFFFEQVFQRATGKLSDPVAGKILFIKFPLFNFMDFPYILYLFGHPDGMHPWSFYLIPAMTVFLYFGKEKKITLRSEKIFLVWWVGIVFSFFVITGNHAWYLLPMYVPSAVLIGGMFHEAIEGDFIYLLGLLVGSLTAIIGAIIRYLLFPDNILLILSEILIILFISIVTFWYAYRGRWFSKRFIINKKLTNFQSYIMSIIAVIIVISLIGGAPPLLNQNPIWNQQEEMGKLANQKSNTNQKIYIQKEFEMLLHTFSFHAKRDIKSISFYKINNELSQGELVVIRSNKSSNIDRNTSNIYTGDKFKLIKIEE